MRLYTSELVKKYKARTVVDHVSIDVNQGEIVGLLGPNGAGKTTTFYMIVGLIKPNEGRIFLEDDEGKVAELTKEPVYKRAQMGVGYLKNFVAVCLAGLIILVLLVSFPIVLGGLNAASAGVPVVDSIVGGLSYALQYLAMCVLLILSLVKSGSWARDIMGG